jgi:2,3-bisphosphoglycerate-dependent phosphoglycerate mutase
MPELTPRRLTLIRHGESQVTVDRVIGGHRSCTGLSALGRLQAERLCNRLQQSGELSDARLISSHFSRARETAFIISPAFDDSRIVEDPSFGEHDPGPLCDGMSYDSFSERFGAGPDWDDVHGEVFPEGETRAQFQLRIGSAIHRLLSVDSTPSIVIACHAGVIGAAFRELLALPTQSSFDLEVRNASITEFVRTQPHRWKLVRHNDAAHLAGLEPATTVG